MRTSYNSLTAVDRSVTCTDRSTQTSGDLHHVVGRNQYESAWSFQRVGHRRSRPDHSGYARFPRGFCRRSLGFGRSNPRPPPHLANVSRRAHQRTRKLVNCPLAANDKKPWGSLSNPVISHNEIPSSGLRYREALPDPGKYRLVAETDGSNSRASRQVSIRLSLRLASPAARRGHGVAQRAVFWAARNSPAAGGHFHHQWAFAAYTIPTSVTIKRPV